MLETGEQFLHRKDPSLHTSTAVEHEVGRKKIAGEVVSQKPADKISSFLKIIERTHEGHRDDPRVLERIKDFYYREYIITPENIPQSYWNLQGEIAIKEGRKQDLIDLGISIEETKVKEENGNESIRRTFIVPPDKMEEAAKIIISNQRQSLNKWVNYLSSKEATYPMWAKYWAFRSVVKMGRLEKCPDGKTRFSKRGKDTVVSFPVLNNRALALTIGAMSDWLKAKGSPKSEVKEIENLNTTLSKEDFQKLLSTEDFSRFYAQFLSEIPQYSTEGLKETRGEWVKYKQGSDPAELVNSLQGHPLEWCTADYDTAKTQLEGGDFYVYYSLDDNGDYTIPRLAIRMEGNRIAEPPRGIAPKQNLDPYISDVLERKLLDFGEEAEAYKKRAADMKQLTAIEEKVQAGQILSTTELFFLYEIDRLIEGFGYERDPRIEEILSKRNHQEDLPFVFNCTEGEIARNVEGIGPDTKIYVGKLEPGIFDLIREFNIKYVFTAFPIDRVRIETVEMEGETLPQIERKFKQDNIEIDELTKKVLHKIKIPTSLQGTSTDIVILSVFDMDLKLSHPYYPTVDEICQRAEELGLYPCQAEIGTLLKFKTILRDQGSLHLHMVKQRDGSTKRVELGYSQEEELSYFFARQVGPDSRSTFNELYIFSLHPPLNSGEPKRSVKGTLQRFFKR